MAQYDLAILGNGPASLFAAHHLADAGLKLALYPGPHQECTLGVVWPGLTEHWGLLRENLGSETCEALLRLLARSAELLQQAPGWPQANGQRGAVLQLASNPTEMLELTMHLRWLNKAWPRRLMSAGAASNYLSVEHVEGAAFVSGCCSFQAEILAQHLQDSLKVTLIPGAFPEPGKIPAEMILIGLGHTGLKSLGLLDRWIFPQLGVLSRIELVEEAWNPALTAVESHRGHLWILPDHQKGWLIGGLSPEGASDLKLLEILWELAGQQLTSLQNGILGEPRWLPYTASADGLPVVGPLAGGKTWVMTAFASRDWSLAPALGEQVARAILGEGSPELGVLDCLRPARFLGR